MLFPSDSHCSDMCATTETGTSLAGSGTPLGTSDVLPALKAVSLSFSAAQSALDSLMRQAGRARAFLFPKVGLFHLCRRRRFDARVDRSDGERRLRRRSRWVSWIAGCCLRGFCAHLHVCLEFGSTEVSSSSSIRIRFHFARRESALLAAFGAAILVERNLRKALQTAGDWRYIWVVICCTREESMQSGNILHSCSKGLGEQLEVDGACLVRAEIYFESRKEHSEHHAFRVQRVQSEVAASLAEAKRR